MRFDRLVVDLVNWIRRLLWAEQGRSPQPYKAIKESKYPRGVLKVVAGRDTPRAIATYIFSPKAEESEYLLQQARPRDWHIYLDWSSTLKEFSEKGIPYRRDRTAPTHRITILKASHTLGKGGAYDVEYVFSEEYNFAAGAVDMWRASRVAIARVAILTAKWEIRDYRWPEELAEIYRRITRIGKPNLSTYAYREWGE